MFNVESISLVLNGRKVTPPARADAPKVLLVSHLWDIACDLPQVFVAAGVEVDVLCPNGNCAIKGGFHDGWWDAGPSQETLFERLHPLMQSQRYCKIILCDDPLLWQIAYRPIEALKSLLPVKDTALGIMNKAGLSQFCQQHALPTPSFFVLHHAQDTAQAAQQVSYPLLIKPNLSNGGLGIVVCPGPEAYQAYWQQHPFSAQGYVVQQHLEGSELSVEALFHQGQLLEYATSKVLSAGLKPSTRRLYQQKTPSLTALLQRFGQASGLDGFVNMGFMLTPDEQYWLFEADPRPNRWVPFAKWFGADFSKAIPQWLFELPKGSDPPLPAAPIDIAVIENMPIYTQELINQGRLVDALLHLTDFDHTWRYLLADPVQLESRLRALHQAILGARR